MCVSPHEMSNDRLQYEIDNLKRYIEEDRSNGVHDNYWQGRIESLEKILKERAENGTYANY